MAGDRVGNYWGKDDFRWTEAGMADWFGELGHLFVAQTWALSLLMGGHPEFPLTAFAREEDPQLTLIRTDSSTIPIPVGPSVEWVSAAAASGAYSVDVGYTLVASHFLTQLGDAVEHAGFLKKYNHEPLIQFLRHVRNGLAHGSYFYFKHPGVLDTPARLRKLEITFALNGTAVFAFLRPGDFFDLLSDLRDFFRLAS